MLGRESENVNFAVKYTKNCLLQPFYLLCNWENDFSQGSEIMDDFLAKKSGLYQELMDYSEPPTIQELSSAYCDGYPESKFSEQVAVLMKLDQEDTDIFQYVTTTQLYSSLKDEDAGALLDLAKYLVLPADLRKKLEIQIGLPASIKYLIPTWVKYNPSDPKFWVAIDNLNGLQKYWKEIYRGQEILIVAAEDGSLKCLRWLSSFLSTYFTEKICAGAAAYGQLECLKQLHESGCPWDDRTTSYAAYNGHLETLIWAHQNGCRWTATTCKHAARNGELECLKYAHNNGCPWDVEICYSAAIGDQLECLQWAHQNGCPWNEWTCDAAAGQGNLECLKYAHENGCPWSSSTHLQALEANQISCLRYMHDNGCPIDPESSYRAAGKGYLKVLKSLHHAGCPWHPDSVEIAAQNSHYECLRWMISHGAPYNKQQLLLKISDHVTYNWIMKN